MEGGVPVAAPDDDTLPLRRVEICRRLMEECHDNDARLPTLRWDTPLGALFYNGFADDEDLYEYVWFVEGAFGLNYIEGEGQSLQTLGDLVLHIEGRLRDLWPTSEATCTTQATFYALRRALPARPTNWYKLRRLRPATPLRDGLPAAEADALRPFLLQSCGAEPPVSFRVFGRLEFGATWLALWFLVLFGGGLWLLDPRFDPRLLPLYFIASPVIVALVLCRVSWPVWHRGIRTLGDLTHWTLEQKQKSMHEVRRALQSGA